MQASSIVQSLAVAAIVILCVCLPLASCDDVIIQKRVDSSEMERLLGSPKKRPFCNAFTGCGKKRSDESMATLLELNSEPAVEELSRQIMSEAKLWEAIQEARIELIRRRHQQMQTNQISDRPLPFTAYRKKRATSADNKPRVVEHQMQGRNMKP